MSEAKTITLTIGERVAALKIFDAFSGTMATMKSLLDDVKQLPVTEEEWTKANLVKTPIAGGQEQWKWDETVNKEVTLQGDTVDYLKTKIKEKSDGGQITMADVSLASLDEKLK